MSVKYSKPVRNRLDKIKEMIPADWKFAGVLSNGRVALENKSIQVFQAIRINKHKKYIRLES